MIDAAIDGLASLFAIRNGQFIGLTTATHWTDNGNTGGVVIPLIEWQMVAAYNTATKTIAAAPVGGELRVVRRKRRLLFAVAQSSNDTTLRSSG